MRKTDETSCVIASPLGPIRLAEDAEGITSLRFDDSAVCTEGPLPGIFLPEAARQLAEYFTGIRRDFDLPLSLRGTPFQRRAWETLRAIPFGEVRTYGEQAAAMGCPKAARAVGMANRRNPIAILVPCHRVVGKGGALTGYAYGLERKRALLALEARRTTT